MTGEMRIQAAKQKLEAKPQINFYGFYVMDHLVDYFIYTSIVYPYKYITKLGKYFSHFK